MMTGSGLVCVAPGRVTSCCGWQESRTESVPPRPRRFILEWSQVPGSMNPGGNDMNIPRPLRITWVLASLLALSLQAGAQESEPPERFRVAGAFGVDAWSDLGDIEAFQGGSFDEAGLAIDLAFHWAVAHLGLADVLLGGNIGGFIHGSNIVGFEEGEDLTSTTVYLTPSVKFAFGKPGSRRLYLDAGLGYYSTTVDEYETDCWWDCDIHEYYDDDTFGGFVGVSGDFPVGSSGVRVTMGVQVHFVNFDDPVEVAESGKLDGPIYVLDVGVAWGL
jgi:hypothetical protein